MLGQHTFLFFCFGCRMGRPIGRGGNPARRRHGGVCQHGRIRLAGVVWADKDCERAQGYGRLFDWPKIIDQHVQMEARSIACSLPWLCRFHALQRDERYLCMRMGRHRPLSDGHGTPSSPGPARGLASGEAGGAAAWRRERLRGYLHMAARHALRRGGGGKEESMGEGGRKSGVRRRHRRRACTASAAARAAAHAERAPRAGEQAV